MRGRWVVKKVQNSVYLVIECPLSPNVIIAGNGKDEQGSLEVFNKGRSRGRDNKRVGH